MQPFGRQKFFSAQKITEKKDWTSSKSKIFTQSIYNIKKMKRQSIDWENIFHTCTDLTKHRFQNYKALLQLNNKSTKNPILKIGKGHEQTLHQENI